MKNFVIILLLCSQIINTGQAEPINFDISSELSEIGISPQIPCKNCQQQEYGLSTNKCGMNCEELYILSNIASKVNRNLRSYDDQIYTEGLAEEINTSTQDIIKHELSKHPVQTQNKIKKSLLAFMAKNQSELVKLEIDKKKEKVLISDDPKKQAKFVGTLNQYLKAMDDELKELKRNQDSIVYAMSTTACDKKAWELFSEYILGDDCEEGLYFKYVKRRRDLSSKLARAYRESLPEDLDQAEIDQAIKNFRGFITKQNVLCDEAVENVSTGLQATVNNAQTIYQGVLGGIMIAASGGLAAPAASVELANLGRTMAALGNMSINATGFYYLADTAKTMTRAGIDFLNSDDLSAWCALSAETLKENGNSFENMWKEGIVVGGLGVVLGGVGGAVAKSSSTIIKGLGITGLGVMGGIALREIIVNPMKQKELLDKLKDNYNDSAPGLKVKRCIDVVKSKITAGQAVDIGAIGLGIGQSSKALRKYGHKSKPKPKPGKKIQKPASPLFQEGEFLSAEDVARLTKLQEKINDQPKSRIILRKSEELNQKIKTHEIKPRNIFDTKDIVRHPDYTEVVRLAKRMESKDLMISSFARITEELNKYLSKKGLPLNNKSFEKFLIKKAYQLDIPPENISVLTKSPNSPLNAGKVFLDINPNGSLRSTGQSPELYARNLQMIIAVEESLKASGKTQTGKLFGTIRESQGLYDELFTSVNKNIDGGISTVPKQNMSNEKFMTELFSDAFPTLVN